MTDGRPESTTGADVALRLYAEADDYVNSLIVGPPSPAPGTPIEVVHARAVARLDRLRAFLAWIGNPEARYPTIHIGGTSGKGSTTAITGSILRSAGFHTGVHVSPYLQVATEKLQVDGELVSATRFHELVFSMRERVESWVASGRERLNYGEFWVAMVLQYFAEERVDVGVVEVGAGGRFDVTNVIQPEVAAITSIGFDHMATLGSTLEEIAWHKAGIIKPGSRAVTGVIENGPLAIIDDEARRLGVRIQHVREGHDYRGVESSRDGTAFTDVASGRRFQVPLSGSFQAANSALAIAICRAFNPARIGDETIDAGLRSTRFPGRIEVVQERPLVVLDGAHNPEKVAALVESLEVLFQGRRIVLVFGVLESKRYAEMLDALAPHAAALIATAPRVIAKPAVDAEEIAQRAATTIPTVLTVPDPIAAARAGLDLAGPDDLVLITGSLYLVGNVRDLWYPREQILAQGTCWPRG